MTSKQRQFCDRVRSHGHTITYRTIDGERTPTVSVSSLMHFNAHVHARVFRDPQTWEFIIYCPRVDP